ncbi:dUTP diphosphatase [Sneathiella sp. HT1-7]|jgi:dUTP pyrophosphatase|uniref:dUTP diphosphatase n=1 Tax=Sneathiella sp. HT1-7 TaxID=2887192 RepID=UPI001D13FB84|nr:dUTP diphosphatase [Sneathiella sp. HT1-7]MCC3303920.1 dUTP diphosphatase [Sneathiella sp. HT1-7]
MTDVTISITRLPHGESLPLPSYETEDSAGMDVRAAVETAMEIPPGGRALVPTGFKMALPRGYEAQVRPRSGLALKKGITLPNSPGTIDADYRGEVGIILMNAGKETFVIERGDRIAQMVIVPVIQAGWREVETLDETARGEGGFGSTGVAEVEEVG